jgi:DNA-binding NarL/FixJ family response regulator
MMKSEGVNPVNFMKPLSLWLAEDDDTVRELLSEFFNRSELKCARQFSCAEHVVNALQHETAPDVVLLDINMGGLDGIEAIEPIKRLASGVRVFIMTTFYDSMALARARNAGASGFFLKRDDWEESIVRMLDTTMDWKKEEAAVEGSHSPRWMRRAGFALAESSAAA